MLTYQIEVLIKPYKTDEFVKAMHSYTNRIRKNRGCLGYSVYQDSEKENTYSVVGKWKTRQAMEEHFRTHDFEVLIGASRVLGETFTMNIAETSQSGGFELAREQIASQKHKSEESD